MEFLHPEFLYYMLPPLFILFGLLLTQKQPQQHFFSKEVMQRLKVSSNRLSLKVRTSLFMLIGVLLVIALAGPVIPEGKVEVKAKSADIMLALDISDSMLAEDIYPNRLNLAKQKALELLKAAPNERIGIIAFAKNSYLVSPLSFDHDAVSFLLRSLSTDSITEKGTDFLSMLEVVSKSMEKETKKYLLILSDGGDQEDFSKEIAYAKEQQITVFVLGVASQKGAPIKRRDGTFIKQNGAIIVSKLNPAIKELALKTGGVFIGSVNSRDDVLTMLKEIESHSEQKELKSQEIARFIPLFYYPVALALLLLLVATSSMSKREKVVLPSSFLLLLSLTDVSDVEAGLLDFQKLEAAKTAYERGDYNKSANIYESYAKNSQKNESYYNAANALYKEGKFKEARALYEKATFDKPEYRAYNFANLGNSYAKEPTKENLQSAIKAYESSLKLQEDRAVRDNLEAVKKALEKMQEENKQENQEEQDNQQNQENSQNDKEQNKESQNSDNNSSQNQQKSQEQNQEQQENKEQENPQNAEQNSQERKNKSEQKANEEKEKQDSTQQQEKQKGVEELQEEKQEDAKEQQESTSASDEKPQEMSDKEEQKWLQRLNQQPSTYLYRLNEQKPNSQESTDAKPW